MSNSKPRVLTIPEAGCVLNEAAGRILISPHSDEERSLIAEHLGTLFDRVASIRAGSRSLPLFGIPLIDFGELLSDINEELDVRYEELKTRAGGNHPSFSDIPPEVGALMAVILNAEAVINDLDLDRTTN